jgi:cytoskeletal protein CcmA (bactofilin family)
MIQNQTFSSLGKATTLEGKFTFNGQTHLLGKLNGEITITEAKLVLEIGSITEATIKCADAEIYGEFTGDIHASGNIVLYPTAVVNGKIIARSLEILPGAVVNINGHTEESLS